MAMAVLKVANIPIYGYPGQISSLQQAAGLLGPGMIKNIILRTPILERFSGKTALSIDFLQLWIHSGIIAAISGGLGRLIGGMESDVSFTCGLIHDTGAIALSVYFPAAFSRAQDFADKNQVGLIEAEQQVLGFSHLEVAGEMMEHGASPYNFPKSFYNAQSPKKII
jgi:HD-like signal output (HDOD) protein